MAPAVPLASRHRHGVGTAHLWGCRCPGGGWGCHATPRRGGVSPQPALTLLPPLPGCFSRQVDPCGKTGQIRSSAAALGSRQWLPHRGGEPNPETGQAAPPSPPPLWGEELAAPPRTCPRAPLAAFAPAHTPPLPNQGWGWGGSLLGPLLRPRRRLGTGRRATLVPVPPAASARAQRRRECLAFLVPAGCLPAGAGRSLPGGMKRRKRKGPQGHRRDPLTLPRATLHPGTPSHGAARGTSRGVGIPDGAGSPSPRLPTGTGGCPCLVPCVSPPHLQPRPPASPCAGLGAGSWERAIFSPSAPDDAGGFFGSGSLLRQREQNQSGCLVGLETNKHAGSRRGQAGAGSARAGTGLPAPQNPKILPGLLRAGGLGTAAGCSPLLPRPCCRQLPGNAVRAGLAPWFRAPPCFSPAP